MGCCGSTAWNEETAKAFKTVWYNDFENNIPICTDKVIAITGCTTGTGYQLAKCALKKEANVIMLNRPSKRHDKAFNNLKELFPKGNLTYIPCDLTSFESVRSAAKELNVHAENGIDVLACNAAVMAFPDEATADGYDVQMQTNHLSHFLLVRETFSLLETAANKNGEARVVSHTSLARSGKPLGEKYFGKNGGDLGGNGASMLCGGARWERYHQTKLANITFAQALHQKLRAKDSKIKSIVAAPGLAATNLQVTTGEKQGMTEFWIMKYGQSAADGSMPLIHCCLDPSAQCGDFFEPVKKAKGLPKKTTVKRKEKDANGIKMLWEQSEKACGVQFDV
jgi:NAD(P)-dependent dehydrogenase (short-subunit alcohol dehydrogenase family)